MEGLGGGKRSGSKGPPKKENTIRCRQFTRTKKKATSGGEAALA